MILGYWTQEYISLFSDGSEHIGDHPDFQQYKGKLDMVFTSPPYFIGQYSEDKNNLISPILSGDDWRDNFLKPTLTSVWKKMIDIYYGTFWYQNRNQQISSVGTR